MDVLCWIDHACYSKESVCCACDPIVHLDDPTIVCICPHLGVCSPCTISLCDFACYVVG